MSDKEVLFISIFLKEGKCTSPVCVYSPVTAAFSESEFKLAKNFLQKNLLIDNIWSEETLDVTTRSLTLLGSRKHLGTHVSMLTK